MHYFRRLPGLALLLLGLFTLPGVARAQELYTYTAGVLGGVGGSFDVSPGNDYGNRDLQLNLGVITEPHTLVSLRAGKLSLDRKGLFGTLSNADLTYATLAGEYRMQQSYYDSGVFLGFGGYRLRGDRGGRDRGQTSIGLTAGATAEFRVNRFLGVLLELSGHYVNLDEAKVYGMLQGGLSVRF